MNVSKIVWREPSSPPINLYTVAQLMTPDEREQRRIENYNLASEFFMEDDDEDDGPSMR